MKPKTLCTQFGKDSSPQGIRTHLWRSISLELNSLKMSDPWAVSSEKKLVQTKGSVVVCLNLVNHMLYIWQSSCNGAEALRCLRIYFYNTHLKQSTFRNRGFVLAHSLRGLHPRLVCPVAFEPERITAEALGGAKTPTLRFRT